MNLGSVSKELSLVTEIGVQFILPLVLMLIGGRYIVDKFELSRTWLLLAIVIGLVSGVYLVIKRIKKIL